MDLLRLVNATRFVFVAMSAVIPMGALALGQSSGPMVQWGATADRQANNRPPLAGPYMAIAAGAWHSVALQPDGSLVQWGDNRNGQTNNLPSLAGPYIAIAAGETHSLALRAGGSLVQWGDTTSGQANNQPPLAGPYIAIAAGTFHSLALRADGSLVQWGDTTFGQANNQPSLAGPYIAIAAGFRHSLALRADGSLVQWGGAADGQLNNQPPLAGPYIAIAAGRFHSLALKADGTLVQWGDTTSGQTNNQPAPAEKFIAIATRYYHNLALRSDGSMVQWGSTIFQQTNDQPSLAGPYFAIAAGLAHSLATIGPPNVPITITYQGKLSGNGGAIDVRFRAYDAPTAGSPVGSAAMASGVTPDQSGVFTAPVTFADVDFSIPLWLEVSIAPAGTGNYTTLSPRQELTPAPRAAFADRAGHSSSVPWTGVVGVPANIANPFNPWFAVSNNSISYTAGSVGIGTTIPAGALSVAGPLTSTGIPRGVHAGVDGLNNAHLEIVTQSGQPYIDFTTGSASTDYNGRIIMLDTNTLQLQANNVRVLGNFINNSDARDKHDVRAIDDALALIEELRGVRYEWNERSVGGEPLPRGAQLGFLAQDVERVLPEVVATGTDGRKGVSYISVVPVLVEAVKQLKTENERLRDENAKRDSQDFDKQKEIAALRARLERIEASLTR